MLLAIICVVSATSGVATELISRGMCTTLLELKRVQDGGLKNIKLKKILEISQEANILLESGSSTELSEEEEQIVQDLKKTDQEVRDHEKAHQTVGGPYAGTATYETQTGPDGKEYAVAGEVPIDASPIRDNPKATIRKMDVVIRAALAPAEPSSQDIAVAQSALQAKLQAQAELAQENKDTDIQSDKEQESNDIVNILFAAQDS